MKTAAAAAAKAFCCRRSSYLLSWHKPPTSSSSSPVVLFLLLVVAAALQLPSPAAAAAGFLQPTRKSRSCTKSGIIMPFPSAAAVQRASASASAAAAVTATASSAAVAGNGGGGAAAGKQMKVAVIGAGAAGLAAARQLSKVDGIRPVILEKDPCVGGVWRYVEKNSRKDKTDAEDDDADADADGDDPRPMYRGLRTNLPRELMAYGEKPWGGTSSGDGSKSYVTHRDVLRYLNDYAATFDLDRCISYGCKVTQLTMLTEDSTDPSDAEQHTENDNISAACPTDRMDEAWPRIKLEWVQQQNRQSASTQQGDDDGQAKEFSDTFDAVCVCNGHYAEPSNPSIPGLEANFRGSRVMHSVQYDDPTIFADQTVLCVGGRASGSDLAREISVHAKLVYLSDSTCPSPAPLGTGEDGDGEGDGEPQRLGNVVWVPRTVAVEEDGTIQFDGSCTVKPKDVDVIIFCSGYNYKYPFINAKSNLDLMCKQGERRVGLMYKQLWHAKFPTLSFFGLPHSVVPFPLFELQAQAVVAQLVGKKGAIPLPERKERLAEAEKDAMAGGPNDPGRVVDTHFLGSYQWDYCRDIAKIAGVYDAETENRIATNKAIYDHAGGRRKKLFPGGPDTYREDCYIRKDEERSFEVITPGSSSSA